MEKTSDDHLDGQDELSWADGRVGLQTRPRLVRLAAEFACLGATLEVVPCSRSDSPLMSRHQRWARRLSNVIGFDDAPHVRGSEGRVGLIGCVCSGPRLDIVVRDSVQKDGADATAVMGRLVKDKDLTHVRAVGRNERGALSRRAAGRVDGRASGKQAPRTDECSVPNVSARRARPATSP